MPLGCRRPSNQLGSDPTVREGTVLGAAPCAWLHARQVLWEWGRQAITDTAELIVSELATNGISASQGLTGSRYAGYWMPGAPPLRRWRHGEPQHIGIQVWDANDQMPVRQATEPDAGSGRGLLLVEALSVAWGSYRPQESSGKVVHQQRSTFHPGSARVAPR